MITINTRGCRHGYPHVCPRGEESSEKTNHWLNPTFNSQRGFKPGCLTQWLISLPTIYLNIHLFVSMNRLRGDIHVPGMAGSTGWLAGYFYFFHLGRPESTTETHLKRSLALLILRYGEGIWIFIFSAHCILVENALLILRL